MFTRVASKAGDRQGGYAPVCGNEWVQGICEKPRIKCSECLHQRFLAVTDDVIRWHLQGHYDHGRDFVIGVYPMLLDETCFSSPPISTNNVAGRCRRVFGKLAVK